MSFKNSAVLSAGRAAAPGCLTRSTAASTSASLHAASGASLGIVRNAGSVAALAAPRMSITPRTASSSGDADSGIVSALITCGK